MEQDCIISLLHQSVGMSVGGEFSSEDVSRIYCKVFHVPSNTDEARSAMKKIAGGDNNWLCVGENVFDVLLEMEREREKKEQLYWDMQLLNVGNNTLYMMDMPDIIDPHGLSCLHQSTNPNTLKSAYHQSDSCTIDTGSSQKGLLVGKNELYVSVGGARRLKKAARHCWARLVSEGVQSIAPSPWQGKIIGVQGQAWGCVSLSDVLLLLEVKYDVVTHLLYTEMLQEHHTQSIWKTLLPWQQHKEHEGLEALAEEVLLSGDMLRLAELPGAFRIYRARLGECFRRHLECREQFWSAVSLLSELHTSRQQERDTLTVLGERLDRGSMRLLCLYIRLATLRAQREKMSYSALLAARQSWETWPHVSSPCRTEQAVLWLQGEEEEHKEDLIFKSPQQQSLLQLLVLTQEQERKDLVKLICGVSLEDLEGADRTVPPKEESNTQSALRNGCIKRLRQIYASPQSSVNPQSEAQSQMQAHMSSKPALWSQHQMENCTLLLLTHLLELHEVQVSALLPELVDKSVQHLQVLWDKYESEVEAPSYTNLLQLLMTDHPLTSDSIFAPTPNVTENSSTDQMITQSGCTGPAEAQSIDRPAKALTPELVTVQAADGTGKQDVCTGCGAVMEELPYLEILCVSDATSEMLQSLPTEKRVQEEEEGNATISPQNYEKQGSLITLAWSKPPDNDTDYEAEFVDGVTEQSQDSESSEKTQAHSSDICSTAECTQYDETSGQTPDEEFGPTGHHETRCADQQCSTKKKLTLEKMQMLDQTQKEGKPDCDLQTHALVTETLQVEQPNLLVDLPDIKPRADDLCSALTSETAVVSRDGIDVETGPTETAELFHRRGPESTKAEDQKYNLQVKAECDFAEREAMRELILTEKDRVRGPVSAMEREMTMRNLVDMQRKVEQKQQRDRERQLLRVQERLSIIQNRKAEEDLLGLKHTDRLKHLTQDLPREDKTQQKTVVKERLEQLRRERSYIMQSKRDRNTAGFKELLGPVALHSSVTEDGSD